MAPATSCHILINADQLWNRKIVKPFNNPCETMWIADNHILTARYDQPLAFPLAEKLEQEINAYQ